MNGERGNTERKISHQIIKRFFRILHPSTRCKELHNCSKNEKVKLLPKYIYWPLFSHVTFSVEQYFIRSWLAFKHTAIVLLQTYCALSCYPYGHYPVLTSLLKQIWSTSQPSSSEESIAWPARKATNYFSFNFIIYILFLWKKTCAQWLLKTETEDWNHTVNISKCIHTNADIYWHTLEEVCFWF